MVKDSKTPRGLQFSKSGGLPRPAPRPRGRSAKPGETKDARLIMRMHPDLSTLIDMRSQEAAMNRSQYVERLIVGFMQADPRNQRVDGNGRFIDGLVSPHEFKSLDPRGFAARWQRYVDAHTILFGAPPPAHWLEYFSEVTDHDHDEVPDPAVGWPRAKKK